MQIRWNEFEGRQFQANRVKGPRVTLDKRGVFYLNEAAWVAMRSPGAVQLFIDDSGHVFGMKAADIRRPNAFLVRQRSASKHHRVSCAAFFQHYRIPLSRTITFPKLDLDNNGVMILDMSTSVTVARGAR